MVEQLKNTGELKQTRTDKFKHRWVEIQVYTALYDLLNTFGDVYKALDYIKLLQPITKFNYEVVEKILLRVIKDSRMKPSKDEIVICAYEAGYSIRALCRKMKVNTSSYYHRLSKQQEYGYYISTYITDMAKVELTKFLKALSQIKKVGFE